MNLACRRCRPSSRTTRYSYQLDRGLSRCRGSDSCRRTRGMFLNWNIAEHISILAPYVCIDHNLNAFAGEGVTEHLRNMFRYHRLDLQSQQFLSHEEAGHTQRRPSRGKITIKIRPHSFANSSGVIGIPRYTLRQIHSWSKAPEFELPGRRNGVRANFARESSSKLASWNLLDHRAGPRGRRLIRRRNH